MDTIKKTCLAISFLLVLILLTGACVPQNNIEPTRSPMPTLSPEPTHSPVPAQLNTPIIEPPIEEEAQPLPVGWEVELVVQDLEIPWSVVFPQENRLLITERTGRIREVVDGVLNPTAVFSFDEVMEVGEAGLMGMALHPDYEQNNYVYVCYATSVGGSMIDRVVRLIDTGNMRLDTIILDNIPAARFHAGCRLKFGPDEKLYISTGDSLSPQLAQDVDSLAGKILRVNDDGSIPGDNPFADSPVFSTGHRNPQGISWDSEKGIMYASEHGPSGFDGPGGGDEINFIIPGGNYGWPLVSHDEVLEGTIKPMIQFTPAEAPGSMLFYDRDELPFFKGNLFFGALRGEGVMRLIAGEDGKTIQNVEKIVNNVGRVREVTVGPDGSIYFTTSNRDGRADPREGDDRLFRIIPVFE